MLRLDRTEDSPALFLSIVKSGKKPQVIVKKECNIHGHTTFVLDSFELSVCIPITLQQLDGMVITVHKCAKCAEELEGRSTRRIIAEAHTRTIKKVFGNKCVVCEYDEHPEILEFHHVLPEGKNDDIGSRTSFDFKLEEAQKCVLVCPTCHSLADKGLLEITPEIFEKQLEIVQNNIEDVPLTTMEETKRRLEKTYASNTEKHD